MGASNRSETTTLSMLLESNLKRYVRSQSKSEQDAEDIYQETLVRVIERARQKDKESVSSPIAYAIRVARNLIIASPTKLDNSEESSVFECSKFCPERAMSTQQELKQIEYVINQMPPLRQKVFIMRRLLGLARGEIASSLTMSPESVTKHIVRAMSDIQQHLDSNK